MRSSEHGGNRRLKRFLPRLGLRLRRHFPRGWLRGSQRPGNGMGRTRNTSNIRRLPNPPQSLAAVVEHCSTQTCTSTRAKVTLRPERHCIILFILWCWPRAGICYGWLLRLGPKQLGFALHSFGLSQPESESLRPSRWHPGTPVLEFLGGTSGRNADCSMALSANENTSEVMHDVVRC